jgi:hypothetical protein
MKLFLTLLITLNSSISYAYSPILREYQSIRAAGMGNVRYTTGLYEENLFANPARSTDNPVWRFQLPRLGFEVGKGALSSISDILSSSSGLSAFSDSIGDPLSFRFQMIFPGYFAREFITNKWSFGTALFTSLSAVPSLDQNGTIETHGLGAAGIVFNLSRRLLREDRLSIGTNIRTEVRGSSTDFAVRDFLNGSNVADYIRNGNGLGVDFDLGATFRPHWKLLGLEYQLGAAINQLLDGGYKNISKPFNSWPGSPIATPRTLNLGLSATKMGLFFFDRSTFAFEVTDIGNNKNGSIYRLLHLGTEWAWRALRLRSGINQGYFAGGFGVETSWLSFNLATYGEEMGLNPGILEDRRYALELGFQI